MGFMSISVHTLGDSMERHVMVPHGLVEEKKGAEARVMRPVFGGDRFPLIAIFLLNDHGQRQGFAGRRIMQKR